MNAPALVTMAGPNSLPDISRMSNFEAGIATLVLLAKAYPGIRFGDIPSLMAPERMSGWWTDLKHAAGDIKDGVGDVLKDTFSNSANAAGDAVRLVTDEKVIDGVSRIGTAYATDGGSEGVRSLLGGGGSGSPVDALMDFISNLGSSAKSANVQAASVGNMNVPGGLLPWLLGGGAVLVLLMRKR